MQESVGAAIKGIRRKRGLSQAQFAELVGLQNMGSVSKIESGKTGISSAVRGKLNAVLIPEELSRLDGCEVSAQARKPTQTISELIQRINVIKKNLADSYESGHLNGWSFTPNQIDFAIPALEEIPKAVEAWKLRNNFHPKKFEVSKAEARELCECLLAVRNFGEESAKIAIKLGDGSCAFEHICNLWSNISDSAGSITWRGGVALERRYVNYRRDGSPHEFFYDEIPF